MPHGSEQAKGIQNKTPVDIPSPEKQQTKKKKGNTLGNVATNQQDATN
jgi:hypothetical protein